MANLQKKKTMQQMVDELLGENKKPSQAQENKVVQKVDTSQSSIKPVNTNRDFSFFENLNNQKKIDAYAAPSINKVLPYVKDERTIERYESIPNYNVFERMFDSSKAKAYEKKQSLLDEYIKAQDRTAQKLMSKNNITYSDLESAYVKAPSFDWITGEKDVLMDAVDKYIMNPEQRKSAEEKLQNKGITDEQSELLKEYYKRLSLNSSIKNVKEFADEHEVLGTLASFPSNIAGAMHSTMGTLGAYLTGKPIDSNSAWNVMGNSTDAMREAASKDLEGAGKLAYDVGTSIGDMIPTIAATAATGGGTAVPMLVSGTMAFGNTTRDGAKRGLTPNQIMATGATSAAVEAAFEKIPVEGLVDIFSKPGKEAAQSLVKEIAGQMGREAFEEMGTEAVNSFADAVINGDKSNFELSRQAYMSLGMSVEEATKQTFIDIAKSVGYSGLAGAVSGGIMGGGASALSRIGGNKAQISNSASDLNQLDPLNALGLQNSINSNIDSKSDDIDLDSVSNPVVKENLMQRIKTNANIFLKKALENKGITGENRNQIRLSKVPSQMAQNVKHASGGKVDISNKFIALEGGKLKHEIENHSDALIEASRGQIPLNGSDISSVIDTIYNPDYVEYLSGGIKTNQRETFALIKADEGYIVVVENVGGKQNPNIVAEQILHLTKEKMSSFINGEKSIAEIVYDGTKRKIDIQNSSEDIKNRVTVAQPASVKIPVASTPEASPHSPLSTDSISNSAENVNATTENAQKIVGFDELNKALDRLVGMYKGNENTQTLYAQMKVAVNEYVQTGNQSAIDRAVTLAADIDSSLVGHSYTRKGSGKSSAKAQNNRVTTTFSEGEFVDTLMAYGKSLRDVARSNAIRNQSTEKVTNKQKGVERIEAMRNNGTQRTRGYNETLINKTDAPQELKNEFINNPDIYTQLSNEETLNRANDVLANNDIDSAIAQYHSMLDAKDPAAVPLGYNLSKQLSQAGRLDESVQLVREMSKALTESGQFSQAAAITMLNNDPEAAKRYLIREIDTLNQKGKEQYGKKWTDFELTESELKQFNNIKEGDTDAIKQVYEGIYNRLRKQYPSTMTEKLMELRRVSMLLNVRTNVRNVVSNALLMPVRWTADRVSALGEGVYSLIDPKYQRTQSLNPIRSKQSKKLASEAFETVKSELLGDNKYEDSKGAIRDKQVFKGSAISRMFDTITNGAITKANAAMGKDVDASLLETARNFTYHLLQKGDDVFVKKNFESRMASYLDAQGITDLESIPADAYVLATQEALKATFKDDSALANTMSSFRQLFNKMSGNIVGEALMPFTKTPANLAMRGIDYSPAGVINAIRTFKKANSNADITKGLTQLGQAATGTAAIALGYVLAEVGLLKGALSDDKDEAQFQKQQGELAYSIKTPFGYLTYDWAQPASIPLILGVTIYDSRNNGVNPLEGMKQGTLAAIDSWLELSPLQNLSELFGGYSSPAENAWNVLANDFPLSFIPSQLNAAAKIGDTTQRVAYDSTNGWNSFINQAKAKIPGLSETLPVAYDTWGNPIQRQDNTGEAVIANLLNPGQFGNENVTPIDDEISALYEATNDASVFPRKAAWTENDVKLDNEQYSEFQRIMGKNAYAMADAFINSPNYDSMDDELKVKAIGEMYSFAHALAKSEVTGYDIADSQSYKKAYSVFREKGVEGVAIYYAITANKDGQKNADQVNAVNALDISDEDRGYYLNIMKGELSKEATAAYESGGYEAVYDLYSQKTAVDRIAQMRTSGVERIAAMRNNSQANTSSKEDMVAKIATLRNNTQSNSGVTEDMIARIAAMRK